MLSTASSPKARGQRLKQLRKLTGLSRKAIERKYQLSANTLNAWENALRAGLTEEGARKIIHLYQEELIDCSLNWLLHGEGNPPKRRTQIIPSEKAPLTDLTQNTIPEEIEYFKKRHIEAVIYEVKEDSMWPTYRPGDFVGGIRHYAKDIPRLVGKDCIIETRDGRTYLRRISASTIPDRYNLISTNLETKIERPILYEIDIVACAPVTRHWRGKKW